MSDPRMNDLLKWSIENSDASRDAKSNGDAPRDPSTGFNSEVLAQLLGGPSDADRMRDAMAAIVAPQDQVDLDNKMIAWDNFVQLVEQIDNANNIGPLGLWEPLVAQLDNKVADMRSMAAWSITTAVQNNIKCQERLLQLGTIPKLVQLALDDPERMVRKKVVSTISSAVRNYQPAMNELERCAPDEVASPDKKTDAAQMDDVDQVIQRLRTRAGLL